MLHIYFDFISFTKLFKIYYIAIILFYETALKNWIKFICCYLFLQHKNFNIISPFLNAF